MTQNPYAHGRCSTLRFTVTILGTCVLAVLMLIVLMGMLISAFT